MSGAETSQLQGIRWLPVVSLAIATVAAVVGIFAVSANVATEQYPGTAGAPSVGGDTGSNIGSGVAGNTTATSSPPTGATGGQPAGGAISWTTTFVDLGNPP